MLYIEKIVQFNYPNVATTTETFQKHCILKFFLYISIFSSFIGVLQSSTESKRNVATDVGYNNTAWSDDVTADSTTTE